MLPPLLLVSLSASVLSAILFSYTKWKKSKDRFPSPPSDFFLGHLRILNQNTSCTLADFGKKYGKSRIRSYLWGVLILSWEGDILQLHAANKSIIVLNKAEDANILLNKRGANYSDRPRTILQGEM